MNFKTVLLASVATLLAFGSTGVSAQDPFAITLLNPFAQDEFWQGCSVGARRAAAEVGAELTELDANNLAQTQINQIDVTLQRAPDALLISALDSKAVVPQLSRAMAQGIDVYAYNTAVPDAGLAATVAMDEDATGASAAQKLIDLLREKSTATGQTSFKLLHLVGAVATEAVRLRRDGFNKAIAQPLDGIEITMIEVVTDWKPELAVNGLQDTLTKGAIDAIFTESDFLTPFLVPVLQRAGYTARDGENHVIIGGLGGIPGGLKAIREGWQDFTLNYPIDGMCSGSVHLAAAAHAGKTFADSWQASVADAGLTANAPRLVESEVSGPAILLTADPITADNVDSEQFWANTYRD
jgi:ABC-type sugar transport system substrate-binding protein